MPRGAMSVNSLSPGACGARTEASANAAVTEFDAEIYKSWLNRIVQQGLHGSRLRETEACWTSDRSSSPSRACPSSPPCWAWRYAKMGERYGREPPLLPTPVAI